MGLLCICLNLLWVCYGFVRVRHGFALIWYGLVMELYGLAWVCYGFVWICVHVLWVRKVLCMGFCGFVVALQACAGFRIDFVTLLICMVCHGFCMGCMELAHEVLERIEENLDAEAMDEGYTELKEKATQNASIVFLSHFLWLHRVYT